MCSVIWIYIMKHWDTIHWMDQVATEILIVMIGLIKNEKIMIGTKSELRRNIYERIIYIIL
jgi:hypothetical protein